MASQERQGRQGSPTTQEDLSGLGVMASQARQRHSAPDTVKDGCAPGTGAPRWDRGRGFQRARTRLLDDGVTPRLHQGSEAQVRSEGLGGGFHRRAKVEVPDPQWALSWNPVCVTQVDRDRLRQ